jgi:hypothetical protein
MMSESKQHEEMVRFLVQKLQSFGCNNIRAVLPEYVDRQPPEIDGFIPDVYDESGHGIYIGEAKILDDIANAHTLEQLTAYHNKTPYVFLCIPDNWQTGGINVAGVLAKLFFSKVYKEILCHPSGRPFMIPG